MTETPRITKMLYDIVVCHVQNWLDKTVLLFWR